MFERLECHPGDTGGLSPDASFDRIPDLHFCGRWFPFLICRHLCRTDQAANSFSAWGNTAIEINSGKSYSASDTLGLPADLSHLDFNGFDLQLETAGSLRVD
jgi:hypothetical protein